MTDDESLRGENMDNAIDVACNLFTNAVVATRPPWTSTYFVDQRKVPVDYLNGVSLEQQLDQMDRANIRRAILIAPKMGRLGLSDSWHMDPAHVLDAVQKHPTRFSAQLGIDPYEGMSGVRSLERYVTEYGCIGAHLYPHWFELEPDHRKYYPYYAKCCELDIPIQIQVGNCMRYGSQSLPSVGRPILLDTVACDFPELKIIGTHVGWPWVEEMIAMAYKHPNVYISTEAYGPKYWPSNLVHYLNSWGRNKVMFASLWPTVDLAKLRMEIMDLGLRPESAERFFYRNATELYGLIDEL
jgi:predicted TIM-barrel fold metal-dependent hydrolase